jgi:hypothetical protein
VAAWRVFVGFAGTVAAIVVTVAAFYYFSLLVLNLAGRILPLAGRGRRRD